MRVLGITIIGGGLAGSEAAWQAASLGVPVTLYEMRPTVPTAVHHTSRLAELVCSNSFRSDKLDNAVGLLKEEMRRLDSLVLRCADRTRVPAGAALAVDRERFAADVTAELEARPLVTIVREEVPCIPPAGSAAAPVIVATGPLSSERLSADIAAFVGMDHLYFYDAVSPIVLAETIDMTRVFRASRWNRSLTRDDSPGGAGGSPPDQAGDYLNCPLSQQEYDTLIGAILRAESATVHDFDRARFFEGCLPIEVMAHRGKDTLRFGPMKPVGLVDPRTGRRSYAVVQLRQDTLAADHYSLVGFQTQLKWSEQARVFRLIPGLQQAEFVRYGLVHRNTYINGPATLHETWQARRRPDLFFAGQLSGVEGYVESAASGLIAGRNAAALAMGIGPSAPPRTTAIGALGHYVSHADAGQYQPTNITFGIIAPLEQPPRHRDARKRAIAERALQDLDDWARRWRAGLGAAGPLAGERLAGDRVQCPTG